jgi:hypothetical protein
MPSVNYLGVIAKTAGYKKVDGSSTSMPDATQPSSRESCNPPGRVKRRAGEQKQAHDPEESIRAGVLIDQVRSIAAKTKSEVVPILYELKPLLTHQGVRTDLKRSKGIATFGDLLDELGLKRSNVYRWLGEYRQALEIERSGGTTSSQMGQSSQAGALEAPVEKPPPPDPVKVMEFKRRHRASISIAVPPGEAKRFWQMAEAIQSYLGVGSKDEAVIGAVAYVYDQSQKSAKAVA